MRFMVLGAGLLLAACGGGTTGTNYSDPPPMATIVATPSPTPSATPAAGDAMEDMNAADVAVPAANAM